MSTNNVYMLAKLCTVLYITASMKLDILISLPAPRLALLLLLAPHTFVEVNTRSRGEVETTQPKEE